MPISFLHAADIHLDSPLRGLERYEGAPVDRIRGATRAAFSRLVDLAVEKRVDFVLIAGDLYDGDWRDYNTGLFLVRELRRLGEERIPVFLIAGNHDAANKMTRSLKLPKNVHFLSHDRAQTVVLDELSVAVHGQSFAKAAVTENLAAAYPKAVPGHFNIGLLHTGLGGMDGHERYAPCTLDDLRGRGYDYWALGHIHARQTVCEAPLAVFAGNIQGRHVRETGPKGCLLLTVHSDQRIEPDFCRLDRVRWERVRVDISALHQEESVLARAVEVLDGLLTEEPHPDGMLAVRVTFAGTTVLHDRLHIDVERLIAEVRNLAAARGPDRVWIEQVELQTQPPRKMAVFEGPFQELLHALEQFRAEPDLMDAVLEELGELKRRLPAELMHDPDSPRLDDALWLKTLLPQVQPVLLDLLASSEGGNALGRDAKSDSRTS
jgi:DNA repair exonuclease SbcCD nuclease subunit